MRRCQGAPGKGTTSSQEVLARQKQVRGVTTKGKDILMGIDVLILRLSNQNV